MVFHVHQAATREASIIRDPGTMFWYVKFTWFANLIAFILGLFLYKRFPREIKIVYYFVVLGALAEVSNKIIIHFVLKNSMPVGHVYYTVAIVVLGLYYIQILNGFIKPVWIKAALAAYVLYSVINMVFIQGLLQYPSITATLGALILFLLSIAFFIKVMIEAKIEKLSSNPHIWINTAVLLYYTVNIFHHSLFNLRFKVTLDVVYFAANTFSLWNQLFYVLIIIGFIQAVKARPGLLRNN